MIKLDGRGLVPSIIQDSSTGQVLMLGYMNPASIRRTLEDGQVWFYSRSREELWHKGEISGSYLNLEEAYVDCDGDTLLLKVSPTGSVCHTGNESCFFQPILGEQHYENQDTGSGILEELFATIQQRKLERPDGSYTVKLLDSGVDRIAQKVIEEAGEAALAGATMKRENLTEELADLLYHSLVLLSAVNLSPEDVWEQLRRRRS